MLTKHNDFDQLEHLKTLTAEQLRTTISGGLVQLGSFDTEKLKGADSNITLSDDYYVGFSHPSDIRNKNFNVDFSSFATPPKSNARIFSRTKEGAHALREGMQKYAEQCGLTADHAFNWSRIFDNSRFFLIHALVEVQNTPELKEYIKTVPIISNSLAQFKNWIANAPANCPNFCMLDKRSVINLNSLVRLVVRERFSHKEVFEIRQDFLQEKAERKGVKFNRAEFKERTFEDRPNKKPYTDKYKRYRNDNGQVDNKSQGDSKLNKFKDSFNKSSGLADNTPKAKQEQNSSRSNVIKAVMPDFEERGNRRKKDHGKKKHERSRKDAMWN